MAALRQIICDLKDTFQSADKSRGESCGFGTRDGPAALRRTTGTLVAWTSRNMAAQRFLNSLADIVFVKRPGLNDICALDRTLI
jgi:hypothetical protein